ncbi:DNA replication/repair protein RecF [Aestuariimicrobium sp. T2.26MG-19.2B]|uniref:DNA replication/repair protein RecF n=1 Tax=Aestuariimicrobium sp. T2.26MG-19.2B TaxID=3040679 RepID=UPI00247750A7|nr:DNA replication/repair protein RecF [Aestuariimicrobium sp. T2.26MG-19.2B]CAI9403632.1 DNA replication and repair protein RecF [Aestuariimicrobium sp. T2.26MG-19.2B]
MYVEHLSLADFRSYTSAEVPLAPGVTVFIGANGQGKTNLVEAVEYLSRLGSHRVSSDAPLVRLDAEQAIVRGRVKAGRADGRSLLLEVEINPGRANRARINKAPLARTRELLGVLRTVVFSPEDLAIVKGDPSDRRAFIDAVVTTRWPRMAGVRADYDRVVKQRNSLLKAMSGRSLHQADAEAVATLEIWDDQVATIGAELLLARLDSLAELMPIATEAYADIAPQNNVVTADYKTALDLSRPEGVDALTRDDLADRLRQAMAERRRDEIARGVSLVGPHRDDVVFNIGRLPAKGYASHGESWSLALALRLGTFGLLQADGIEPVLVLDDVFAELDATRRERLAESVLRAEQVLVTAAVGADVPAALAGRRFRVRHGLVEPEDES